MSVDYNFYRLIEDWKQENGKTFRCHGDFGTAHSKGYPHPDHYDRCDRGVTGNMGEGDIHRLKNRYAPNGRRHDIL
jgi:hypothetical protein